MLITDCRPEDAHDEFIHAFNAYSPPGDVTGELVYVNYGRWGRDRNGT